MAKLSAKYDPLEAEKKWQKYWEDNGIFKFDWNNTERSKVFSIDTPPPTVSGTLHMGHIFSFTHTDFIARYQRMQGKNVFYPIGFDDNGLPTERYVEKLKGIKGKEMSRVDFIKICQENIKKAEDVDFSNLFHSISHSYDWSLKYQTISDTSKHVSQLSFIDLYNKGVLYRKDEPCIWDVIDQTALAQTEVEDKEFESQKNYLKFKVVGEEKNNNLSIFLQNKLNFVNLTKEFEDKKINFENGFSSCILNEKDFFFNENDKKKVFEYYSKIKEDKVLSNKNFIQIQKKPTALQLCNVKRVGCIDIITDNKLNVKKNKKDTISQQLFNNIKNNKNLNIQISNYNIKFGSNTDISHFVKGNGYRKMGLYNYLHRKIVIENLEKVLSNAEFIVDDIKDIKHNKIEKWTYFRAKNIEIEGEKYDISFDTMQLKKDNSNTRYLYDIKLLKQKQPLIDKILNNIILIENFLLKTSSANSYIPIKIKDICYILTFEIKINNDNKIQILLDLDKINIQKNEKILKNIKTDNDLSFYQEFYKDNKSNDFIEIMTTRPELLSACVGLMCHPSLYSKYEGKSVITPLGIEVPIVPDEKADLEKGTGFVMCCTFGDQTDIEWWRKHNLELRICLNERGQIKLDCVKDIIQPEFLELEGLKLTDARTKILEILDKNGVITRPPEKITHPVKVGERSKFPIEFLITKQWNIKILGEYSKNNAEKKPAGLQLCSLTKAGYINIINDLKLKVKKNTTSIKEILHQNCDKINWHPKWMASRMHDWIDGISWDWTISRQRFSGISLPVWYSKRAGEEGKIIVADIDQLPVDPLVDLPKGYIRDEVIGDPDVLDTWATSSVSPQLSSLGITDELCVDKEKFKKLPLPFDLRGNAHEIIRTWDFCTLVKAFYHEDKIPWKNLAISGWCLSTDKTKMSKSKGNIIDPVKLIATKGSDALRYWAGNATLGLDTAYSEDQIGIGQKLITKLFNSAKFCEMCFENLKKTTNAKTDTDITATIDKWLLQRMSDTIKKATASFENYEFNKAIEYTEKFFWNDFCDNYLEIVKVRCYGASGFKYKDIALTEEQTDKINAEQQSAIKTIYYVFNALLKLLAPFIPAICEEIYSCLYEDEFNQTKSISAMGTWVNADDFTISEDFSQIGNDVLNIVAEIRKHKSEKNISIKETIEKVKISTENDLENVIDDLKNVCNVREFVIEKGEFKIEI